MQGGRDGKLTNKLTDRRLFDVTRMSKGDVQGKVPLGASLSAARYKAP